MKIRNRAVLLLEAFFARDGERTRRQVFNTAFDACDPNPARDVEFSGAIATFAGEAVDRLLAFGCVGRGRHSLSLLLTTMATERGRQPDPDYADLPPLLDAKCALPTRAEERRYLEGLLEHCRQSARRYSPLQGIAQTRLQDGDDGSLDDFEDNPHITRLLHSRRLRHENEAIGKAAENREYDDILAAFGDVKRAALLGEPGSGKSTTLRKLAADQAARALDDSGAPLPLLVELGEWRRDEPLADFLADRVPEIGWAARALSQAGRLILLLDGLNEVPAAKREERTQAVRDFQRELQPATPVIVSCREKDYTGGALDLGLDTLTLEPLSPQRVRAALHRWVTAGGRDPAVADRLFWQLAGDERLADVLEIWLAAGFTEEAFWSAKAIQDYSEVYQKTTVEQDEVWRRHVPNPRSLVRLASNPFMLTMLYAVWRQEGELPANRGELFADFVESLLGREGPTDSDKALLQGLQDLAWRMQTERVEDDREEGSDYSALTVVSREEAIIALGDPTRLKKAEDATLLEGGDEIRFRHQLLQEYFTARALEGRLANLSAAELWPRPKWWERSGWEEACVLLAGLYSEDCTAVIESLAEAQPEAAAQCIAESGAKLADEAATKGRLRACWLPRLTDIEREPAPEARAAVGRALGRLEWDDRKGVGVSDGLPDIDWVEIPGGAFLYQDGERREIDTFWIARYPVTNAQFQAFLDAEDGYRDDRCWRGLTRPDRTARAGRWSLSNHPRETVSWHGAMAFCAWMKRRTGRDIRLPTEEQWERAARGVAGRIYPWGDTYLAGRANINETFADAGPHYLGRTSAVGIYPEGASVGERVMDLAGNVWEWCLNEYENPKKTQPGGTRPRALRGGSWLSAQDGARASYRNDDDPLDRNDLIGFRVVCSSPIR